MGETNRKSKDRYHDKKCPAHANNVKWGNVENGQKFPDCTCGFDPPPPKCEHDLEAPSMVMNRVCKTCRHIDSVNPITSLNNRTFLTVSSRRELRKHTQWWLDYYSTLDRPNRRAVGAHRDVIELLDLLDHIFEVTNE